MDNTEEIRNGCGMNVIKNCIDMIFTAEETHERGSFTEEDLDEFVDSLNSNSFKK